jgi:hypothetical protein
LCMFGEVSPHELIFFLYMFCWMMQPNKVPIYPLLDIFLQ